MQCNDGRDITRAPPQVLGTTAVGWRKVNQFDNLAIKPIPSGRVVSGCWLIGCRQDNNYALLQLQYISVQCKKYMLNKNGWHRN